MAGNLQPLDEKFAIAGPDGKPTQYFVRWAQQRQIDIGESVSAAQALEIVEQFLTDHPLIAGSGIALAPSGNIGEDVTISAEVQEILDQISTTRGTVLFRGASDWQGLAPGTSGHFLRTNGAGADPTWASSGGGGGLYPINNPTASVFSSTFAGTGVTMTATNTSYGVYFRRTDAGSLAVERVGVLGASIPASTWTATLGVRVTAAARAAGFVRQGLGCTNGTGVVSSAFNTQDGAPAITSYYHATLTSFTSSLINHATWTPDILFFRLVCDGTNIVASYSIDGGQTFIGSASRTIASTFTPTHVGLYSDTFSNTFTPELTGMAAFYWQLV